MELAVAQLVKCPMQILMFITTFEILFLLLRYIMFVTHVCHTWGGGFRGKKKLADNGNMYLVLP